MKLKRRLVVEVVSAEGRLSLEVTKSTLGRELFTLVCSCLGVREFWYFGLEYRRRDGERAWLRPGKRVASVLAAGPLAFQLKYYPEEAGRLEDEAALLHLYARVRRDVLSGEGYCPPETGLLLASYSLQAELGDWTGVEHASLCRPELLPPTLQAQYPAAASGLKDWHRDHEGLTPAEARAEYLRVAQALPGYGVAFFRARSDAEEVRVGVQPGGIGVYEPSGTLAPRVLLKWVFIGLVHYTCSKFVVRPILESLPRYVFQARSRREAKRMFELAVGYHHLHVRSRLLNNISVRSDREERFKETTEEYHNNQVKKPPSPNIRNPVIKRHSCINKKLPTLDEE